MSDSEGQAAVHSGACRSGGLGQNRPGARVESAGSKVGPVDVPISCLVCRIPLNRSGISATACFAAAHFHCSKAGCRLGSDGGSPKDGSTLASKRVMAQIWSPARVST
jgi:hypothetical protein